MRAKHPQSRRGRRDRLRHRRGEGGAPLSHARSAQTKRREPDIPAIGRCERVARVFAKEDGTRGGDEGRGGDGGVK